MNTSNSLTIVKTIRLSSKNSRVLLSDGSVVKIPSCQAIIGSAYVPKISKPDEYVPPEYTPAEFNMFLHVLKVCIDKYHRKLHKRVNLDEWVLELSGNFLMPGYAYSVFEQWLYRYRKDYEKSSSGSNDVGYLYSHVRGYFSHKYMSKVKRPIDISIDYVVCCEKPGRMECLMEAVTAIFDMGFSKILPIMEPKQYRKFIAIGFQRWAYVSAKKPYERVSQFEAAYMGLSIDEAEKLLNEFVEALESERDAIEEMANVLYERHQARSIG